MTPQGLFWLKEQPLVLASGSAARRALLEAVGIPLDILKAPIDEASIAATLLEQRDAPKAIALALAQAKAEAAAQKMPGRIILAADQTLDHNGALFMKPGDRDHVRRQLMRLRGETHQLHSAAVLREGSTVLWAGVTSASLRMRNFTETFLDAYLDAMGDTACETVGGYQLEALGLHLFETIEGDHATILGLPLLPLMHGLRDLRCLAR